MRKRATAKASLHDFRRGEIVAAAREIVATSGLEALTIGALEKRLGFTRGVITYHFQDKGEIVDAVLASALQEIDAATHAEVAQGATAIDKIRAVLRANLHGFLDHREAGTILLSFWGRLGSDPKARKANARLYDVYRERTLSLLDSGDFQFVDSPSLATVIVGLVLGIASQVYFEPGAVDSEGALNEATRCVVARLSGASPRT
ncbi:MAG: TetR/AcrR family transcriptional regulator [Myxococcales bacterium]|nr:TetR family transcriptional regulator [Myxococcales bacterium]